MGYKVYYSFKTNVPYNTPLSHKTNWNYDICFTEWKEVYCYFHLIKASKHKTKIWKDFHTYEPEYFKLISQKMNSSLVQISVRVDRHYAISPPFLSWQLQSIDFFIKILTYFCLNVISHICNVDAYQHPLQMLLHWSTYVFRRYSSYFFHILLKWVFSVSHF